MPEIFEYLKGCGKVAAKCEVLFKMIEDLAPLNLAEQWDNPGLQLGDPKIEVDRLLIVLDVDEKTCREAVLKGAQAIISHHPLFFKPLKQLRTDLPGGALIAALLSAGITVYAAHTNLDNARGGVNDELAKRLDLQQVSVLSPDFREKYLKLVVFVPVSYAENVRSAITQAGAGWIGGYSECTFQVMGTGTFRPLEGSNPFIGKLGETERVEEVRLETILPANLADKVIEFMLKVHPYEEVAYDLYPLANGGPALGPGRIGVLAQSVQFRRFISGVKEALEIGHVRYGGNPDCQITRAAVCGGAGARMWPLALASGAQVMVTSDIDYHTAKDMLSAGLNFIDAGHFGTEQVILSVLQEYLKARCNQMSLNVEILKTSAQSDPFDFL